MLVKELEISCSLPKQAFLEENCYAKNITIISGVSEEMWEVVAYVHISIKRPIANKWYLCSEASTHWGISSVVNPNPGSWCIQGLEMLYAATTIVTPESKGVLGVSSFFVCHPLWQKNVCMCNQCMFNSTTSNISLWKREKFVCCLTKGEMFTFFPFLAHIRHSYTARKSCT